MLARRELDWAALPYITRMDTIPFLAVESLGLDPWGLSTTDREARCRLVEL